MASASFEAICPTIRPLILDRTMIVSFSSRTGPVLGRPDDHAARELSKPPSRGRRRARFVILRAALLLLVDHDLIDLPTVGDSRDASHGLAVFGHDVADH